MKNFFNKYFVITFIAIVFLEFISLLCWHNDQLNKICFALVIITAFILALKKLEWGIYFIFTELIIGSKGYLLAWNIGDFVVSLRLGLFLAIFLAFCVWAIRDKKINFFKFYFSKYYLLFFLFIFAGLIMGYAHGNILKNIFFDWNGYLFFGLIFPLTQAIKTKKQITNLISVLFAGCSWLIIKTFILLFLFSQSNFFGIILIAIYKWVRDTGVGEITSMPNGFSRIFFQSHIYIVIVFFIILSIILHTKKSDLAKYNRIFLAIISSLSLGVIFLSYSRSFYLGAGAALFLFFLFIIFYSKFRIIQILLISASLVIIFALNYLFILGLINFPLPGNNGVNATSLLTERAKDPSLDAGGSSRMELLKPLLKENLHYFILGKGFGSTITYQSKDLRNLANNPSGWYTTYAFEWGYLDLWLKVGLLGLLAYLCLLFKIIAIGYKQLNKADNINKSLIIGSIFSLISIVIIHFFTPYLNHPLGIAWILIVSVFFSIHKVDDNQTI